MSVEILVIEDDSVDLSHTWKCAGKLFDNGDNEISLGIAEEMIDEQKYGSHFTRQPWWGHVFPVFKDDVHIGFMEQIRHNGKTIGMYQSDSLEELFNHVNDTHGW